MGAMENAGCITINDEYIFKELVTIERRAYRCVTIIHELSHMWFGDLVTMKW
jgi:aminopeptidase N